MSKKLTNDEYIEKCKSKFGNKYNYSITNYTGYKNNVSFICPIHGEFIQRADHFLNGKGCQFCSKEKADNNKRKTQKDYLNEIIKIHGDRYDFSLVKYTDYKCKVDVICHKHGKFSIRNDHLRRGQGCSKCTYEKSSIDQRKSKEQFIKEAKLIHGDKYDYSKINYINNYTKVKIICHEHGIFKIKPHDHLILKIGCSKCNYSKGEIKIENYLKENNILYTNQYTFNSCKNKLKLPFDFYLTEYNLCIEYDGKQHFESVNFFGGEKSFMKIQKNDKIKNNYCKNNNINLLRISYKDFNNIDEILKNIIKSLR